MEFMKVDLQNFKRFESLHLDFKPGINILLGGNGVGKTSILEALSIALSDYFNGIPDVPKKGIESNQVRFDTHTLGNVSTGKEYFSAAITSQIHLDKEVGIGEVVRRDNTSNSRTRYLGKGIAQYATRICNKVDSTLPLICYYSTKRLAPPKKENYGVKSKNKLNDRVCGYIGCLDDTLDIKAMKTWCLDMEMEAFHADKPIQEYEVFKKVVSSFMSKMTETERFPKIYYSRKQEEMVYQEDGKSVPINYMSAGYQSLLWMIMDMAFRLAQMNPSVEDFREVPGIVMIDEIDMHLHPTWQWRIVDALHEIFPRIQFILATHSPIIISSAKDAHLIALHGEDEVQYLPNAYAYSVDDILESRQLSKSVPEILRSLVSSFDRELNAGNLEKAKSLLDQLAVQFGRNNPAVIEAQATYDLEVLAVDL